MKYAFTIYVDESQRESATPEQIQETSQAYGALTQEMEQKGVLAAGEGLYPATTATTVRVRDGERDVTDGPFAETKELIAGFWLWRVNSLQDAVEWLKQAPFDGGEEVEIRQIFEASDFGDNLTPELREQERHLSEQIAAKK
jgi:hypothetical protein